MILIIKIDKDWIKFNICKLKSLTRYMERSILRELCSWSSNLINLSFYNKMKQLIINEESQQQHQ